MLKRAWTLVAALLCLCLIGPIGQATEPQPWLTYTQAIADLSWVTISGDNRDEIHGAFSLRLPDQFSFSYQMDNLIMRRILGYRNFTMVQQQGRTSYGYIGFSIFDFYRDLFLALTEVTQQPLVWVTSERMAHREVDRYYLADDPEVVIWIDQQTNIPLLIMSGEQNVLSVENYRFDSKFEDHYRYLELELNFPHRAGKLTLFCTEEGAWVPAKISISQGETEILMTFSNWEIGGDQIGDLTVLEELEAEIMSGERFHGAGQWDAVIGSYKKVLAIDPYYLPGYFFLAHAYYNEGNYLGTVENYQQVLMLVPDHDLALNNLAYTYMERGVNLSTAIDLALQAVVIDRKPTYLDTLGYGYYLIGDLAKAQLYLEEAIEGIDEENRADVEHHLALVYEALEMGDTE